MNLQVNGKAREVEQGTPLAELLRALGVDPATVAVEVNGEIVPRESFPAHILSEGDRVEVVRMVGGG